MLPEVFAPVSRTASVEPTRWRSTRKVGPVAPSIGEHVPLHFSHWKLVVSAPVQPAVCAVSVLPTRAVPVIVGTPIAAGGEPPSGCHCGSSLAPTEVVTWVAPEPSLAALNTCGLPVARGRVKTS